MLVYVYVEIYTNIIRLNCITDSLFLSHVVRVIAINFIQELAFTIRRYRLPLKTSHNSAKQHAFHSHRPIPIMH